jgi:Tfp pilus assembly protein PilN
MRAVNLIPSDARRATTRRGAIGQFDPAHAVIAVLAVALVFATIYTLTNNTIGSRKAKLGALQTELAQAQSQAARLDNYVAFEQLAQQRVETVREIASARFDWHDALADLAKVVPANTALQSLTGSVVPSAAVSGSSGSGSSVRGDEPGPAIELDGCTKTQDDVAQLMSRLRLIDGVDRVTLNSSSKAASSGGGASVGGSSGGCSSNWPVFDIVVFFEPVANAGPTGLASVPGSASSSTSGSPATTTGSAQ